MSVKSKFESYRKKVGGLCDEHNLIFRFQFHANPITLTVRPAGGDSDQTALPGVADETGEGTHQDASIVFAYEEGVLTYRTSETFKISDALFSKLKNLYKNMHSLWLQFLHQEIVEHKLLENLPHIDAEDSIDPEDDPAMTTTVDEGGLVTNVDFKGGDKGDVESDEDWEEGYPQPPKDDG